MKRIMMMLTLALVMAAMMAVMASASFAKGALLRTPCPDYGYNVYTPGDDVRGACAHVRAACTTTIGPGLLTLWGSGPSLSSHEVAVCR